VRETLEDLIGCFGAQADAAFARELTKVFEEVRRDTLESLREHFREHAPRGEFVLLVSNPGPGEPGEEALRAVLEPLLGHLPTRKAAALAAQLTGARRNRVYELALALKGEGRGS
jgi:16S rRNA (cytidine1402-2'-O)-methyltransferase